MKKDKFIGSFQKVVNTKKSRKTLPKEYMVLVQLFPAIRQEAGGGKPAFFL